MGWDQMGRLFRQIIEGVLLDTLEMEIGMELVHFTMQRGFGQLLGDLPGLLDCHDCHFRISEIVHVADLASSSIIGPSVQWSTQWRAPFLQHTPSMCSKHAVPALFCTCECLIYLILASVEQNCRQNCFDLSSKLVKLVVELNGHVRWSATM